MARGHGPERLSLALSELIAQRGYARVRGDALLQAAWAAAAGATIARQTRALSVRHGVLLVAVDHAPLLSELAGFHRQTLIEKLRASHNDLKIRDLKFKLDSGIASRNLVRPRRAPRRDLPAAVLTSDFSYRPIFFDPPERSGPPPFFNGPFS